MLFCPMETPLPPKKELICDTFEHTSRFSRFLIAIFYLLDDAGFHSLVFLLRIDDR